VKLGLSATNLRVLRNDGTALIQTTAPSTATWHHVAYTWNGTNNNLYIDGTAVTATATAHDSAAVTGAFIGATCAAADFFNGTEDPLARGAVLETPGDHVAVSADSDNPDGAEVRFGDINPSYVNQFKTFSAERLFSPIGSNVVNLTFRVPGTDDPAVTRGFGAVYTDIDREENTAFEYFDADGNSLGKFAAPVSKGGLSFLGVAFPDPVVARVKIEYGSGKLGPDDSSSYDVAVMDDFIYGEPQPAG